MGNQEKEECDLPICFKWGSWAEWTECSKSCNGGFRTTSRVCLTNDIAPCGGRAEMAQSCNIFPCPEEESKCKSKKNLFDDKWCTDQAAVNWCTKYNFFMKRNCAETCCEAENQIRKNRAAEPRWSEWSACSVTCGFEDGSERYGVQTRRKICDFNDSNASCSQKQKRECSSVGLCSSSWSSWDSWSPCSTTCGQGVSTRFRICTHDSCEGDATQQQSCFIEYCTSRYSYWSQWSECSNTCGDGDQLRTRSCLNRGDGECNAVTFQKRNCENEEKCLHEQLPQSFQQLAAAPMIIQDCSALHDTYSTAFCRNRLNNCDMSDESLRGEQVRNLCAKSCCQQQKALTDCTDHPLWASECPFLHSFCLNFSIKNNKAHLGCKRTCQLC